MATYDEYLDRKLRDGKQPLSREIWDRRFGSRVEAEGTESTDPSEEGPKEEETPKDQIRSSIKARIEDLMGVGDDGTQICDAENKRATKAIKYMLAAVVSVIRECEVPEVVDLMKTAHRVLVLYRRGQPVQLSRLVACVNLAMRAVDELGAVRSESLLEMKVWSDRLLDEVQKAR